MTSRYFIDKISTLIVGVGGIGLVVWLSKDLVAEVAVDTKDLLVDQAGRLTAPNTGIDLNVSNESRIQTVKEGRNLATKWNHRTSEWVQLAAVGILAASGIVFTRKKMAAAAKAERERERKKRKKKGGRAEKSRLLPERSHYDVLGVPKDATLQTIKKIYRKKALQLHPDKNDSPQATVQFKELTEAYSVLSDPKKRAALDSCFVSKRLEAAMRKQT